MRELSYQLTFERLLELSSRWTSAPQKSSPQGLRRLWIFLSCLLIGLPVGFVISWLRQQMIAAHIDPLAIILSAILLIGLSAVFLTLRFKKLLRQIWEGADNDIHYHVTQDSGGLRFATETGEHYLKWHGITRMWLERDGIVVARGPLLLWIADTAFSNAAERLALIREIFARMTKESQERSAPYLQEVLAEGKGG